jgi:Ni/Co efflux regulator RcnB
LLNQLPDQVTGVFMTHGSKIGLSLALAMVLAGGAAVAEEQHEHGGGSGREGGRPAEHQAEHQAEPHPGPSGYQRVTEPHGWNARPATVDRGAYQHNFQAARSFRVGPYHRPVGWSPHRWVYGEVLPRAFWAPQYLLTDYWLFALEVPPAGYEWVRSGADALLLNMSNGEILQVEYGVFA